MDKDSMLKRLAKLRAQQRHLDTEIDGLVGLLRSPGLDGMCEATWQEVGDALGISRQAAQMRYREMSWAG